MQGEPALPARQQLSIKVVTLLLVSLLAGLTAVGATLYLSWQLEGGAAAINAAGSLRMQTYRLGYTLQLNRERPSAELATQIAQERRQFAATLALLDRGDPARPLYLPSDPAVRARFAAIEQRYAQLLAEPNDVRHDPVRMRVLMDEFVDQINALVLDIEQYNARRTMLMRGSQILLIALAIVGTVTQIYLMFLLVFRPLYRLSGGISRMAEQDYSVRLPVETDDEFGELTRSFNRMADRVADAHGTLEARVQAKTAALNTRNRELALRNDIGAGLNAGLSAEAMCRDFLTRLMQWFGADGGSVRIVDPHSNAAHMVVYEGISDTLAAAEHCLQPGDCLCGASLKDGVAVIHDFRKLPSAPEPYSCEREGFVQVSAFPVRARTRQTGQFNLHFRRSRDITRSERDLLEALGEQLGIALENLRLAAREREIAVYEERNLLAQGLHDSIAQGLSFLNLQVQMLNDSLKRGATAEARDIVPLLKAGVQESYDDVRELLNNFRTRLAEGDLVANMRATIERFRRQTGIAVDFDAVGSGTPLPAEDQLQLLFVLQEALSNVRKHAYATTVRVRFTNERDVTLEIRDDGRGFDAAEMAARAEGHVGLKIMQERASRLSAQLQVESDHGAVLRLTIPFDARRLDERTQERTGKHGDQGIAG
ncbi:type IV pili methyl-accepting chemotaxis transducer N-terminal domain-containing protein [Jeongeupia chitinilytica]|uniref:Sensor protein n=1 Tax=Jeongeupia chitinilytica TaxID=1041641 RepID=A0ABQ3H0T2_9NEIS|nr:type IV pili methyl-accepting chemotaxis transducer N-terminal domain-containing protein [Jeongeupia chitinilytica]GHD61847.1 nitrate/nitrite sensor protein [Jeongeupia chitinilytica]